MKAPACVLLLLLPGTSAVAAPRPLSSSEQAVLNFGFATQLGSGIYSVSGRTLQVYRLPFAYTLPRDDDARWRVRLTLPVTVGFLDFEPLDVIDTGLPRDLDSVSVVPGVELEYAVDEHWRLQPFAEAGIARDRESQVDQRVYSLGLRGLYDVARGPVDWQGYGEIVRVVVEQTELDQQDDFTRVRLGATARRPFELDATGRRADFLVYGFTEAYTDTPSGPVDSARHDGEDLQYEVGFTLGATQTLRIWGMPLPRIGFGYRFGQDLSVYRLVFGSPY